MIPISRVPEVSNCVIDQRREILFIQSVKFIKSFFFLFFLNYKRKFKDKRFNRERKEKKDEEEDKDWPHTASAHSFMSKKGIKFKKEASGTL